MKKGRQLRFALRRKRTKRRGRPPGARPIEPHRERGRFTRRAVCHVRLRVRGDVPRLRTRRMAKALGKAFAGGCAKPGFRLCQFSIQSNHLHLVCEADSHRALGRAMQGLGVRAAKAINRACGRRGSVFAERYRVTRVSTPTQMRNTLSYVLHNARRHGARLRGADPFSSARYFDGFSRRVVLAPADEGAPVPVARPRTRLLKKRWRWIGLIDPGETPAHSWARGDRVLGDPLRVSGCG